MTSFSQGRFSAGSASVAGISVGVSGDICWRLVLISIIPFRGNKRQDFSHSSRKIMSECDLGMNAGKLHESFRNLLDWGICQRKGRQSCSAWLLFFSAEGNTFKPSQHLIFHYLSPNRIAHISQPFFFRRYFAFKVLFGLRLLKRDLQTAVIEYEGAGWFMWCTIMPLQGHASLGRSLELVRDCRINWSSCVIFQGIVR